MPVTLTSLDDVKFTVDKDVAERSILIKNMIEGNHLHLHTLLPTGERQSMLVHCRALPHWLWAIPLFLCGLHCTVITHAPFFLTLITLKIDVGESDSPIPLPNVSSAVLKKVTLWFLLSFCVS